MAHPGVLRRFRILQKEVQKDLQKELQPDNGAVANSATNNTAGNRSTTKTMVSVKTISRALSLSLLAAVFAVAVPARAQQQPPAPQTQEVKSAPRQRGPAQQLAHETREAAGEEPDETAEFKQSPSVAFVARHTGLSLSNAYLFSVVLNFVVIAAVILWAARKYLPGMFRDRTASIQKAMQEAQKASEDARRRLAEIDNRLMKLDGEIGMMRNRAEHEAAEEEARIKAAAEHDARKIIETAQQEITAAAKNARRELTAFAADLAIGLAKKQIHVDAATDQRLVSNFAGELGSEAASSSAGKDAR
jgi:F-type H+-transporting ATPase subunit b